MKITNNGVSQTSLSPTQQTSGAAPAAREAQTDAAAEPNDAYTPSAEWLRLIEQVRQEPEIREDRVREAIQRLQSGEYFSPAAAAKTADAILNAMD